MITTFCIIVLALVVAVARFFIPSHGLSAAGSYEAFAHLFVGFLIGAYAYSRQKFLLWTVLALTAVEIVAFFVLRGQ